MIKSIKDLFHRITYTRVTGKFNSEETIASSRLAFLAVPSDLSIIDALVPKAISFSWIKSYSRDSIRPLTMGHQSREEKQTNEGTKLDRLLSTSGLLLSVACCIAIIHVELRLREHHRLIVHSGTFFNEMEAEIRRKLQENSENGRWQVGSGSHLEG